MDTELAQAVLRRWEDGLPVAETTLYKAAQALDADPDLALLEARYYTALDKYFARGGEMTPVEKIAFSAAAGVNPFVLTKTAGASGFSEEEVILAGLAEQGWAPDLDKMAYIMTQQGPQDAPQMDTGQASPGVDPSQGGQDGQDAQQQMMGQPQPGANVQQDSKIRPAPTAPYQVPPSEMGNLDAILQEAQQLQAQGQDQQPGTGMSEPEEQMTPQDKIQQVVPNLDQRSLERYGQYLQQVEEETGLPVNDPAQITKIIQQAQKADKKLIDEAIKNIGEKMQAEQEMKRQQMQVQQLQGQQQQMAAQAGAGGGQSGDDAALAAGGSQGEPAPGAPTGGAGVARRPPGRQVPVTPQAMAKVASLGRLLARRSV